MDAEFLPNTWVSNELIQSESLCSRSWDNLPRHRSSTYPEGLVCLQWIRVTYLFIYIQYLFLYARVIGAKTPSCCKHTNKILLLQAFQNGALDARSSSNPSSGWEISGMWKWYTVPYRSTNVVQVLPWFPAFVTETAALCKHYLNSATQGQTTGTKIFTIGFSEALAVDLPLLSHEICSKPFLWEN